MTACCHVRRTSQKPAARPDSASDMEGTERVPPRAPHGSAAVERVLQPGEESLLTGLELTRGPLLAAQLGELAQHPLHLRVELGRRGDLDVHDEVAAAAAAQV